MYLGIQQGKVVMCGKDLSINNQIYSSIWVTRIFKLWTTRAKIDQVDATFAEQCLNNVVIKIQQLKKHLLN